MNSEHRLTGRLTLAALAMAVFLSACDTVEERANGHYESALELLEQGDVARAKVELRTVFSLVPDHRGARETFARVLLEEGDLGAAFGQYMRLVEETPDAVEPRLIVAELLVLEARFDDAQEHREHLEELAPDNPRVKVLSNAEAYRQAVLAEDTEARRAVAEEARALASEDEDNLVNAFVLADSYMLDEDFESLMEELDRIQAIAPDDRRLYQFRLTGFARMNDPSGIEQTLREMIERFPDDENLPTSLMRYYAGQGDLDGAEDFLRSRFEAGVADDGARMSLVRFLSASRSPEDALQEAQRMVEEGTNDELFRSIEASILYDIGRRDEAIDVFEGIMTRAEPSAQSNNIKASYARVLQNEGNEVGARKLIEEVLENDPSHVPSLLMRAQWLIDEDRADDAILALRTAQDQDPENPQIFTDLAEAYLRNGERDLAGEMLALAVQTSNRAPDESIVYARYLVADGRLAPAEAVLIDALRLAPRTVDLLRELGGLYIRMEDWGRAEAVERELREIATREPVGIANALRLDLLRLQGRTDEAVAFLEEINADGAVGLAADIAIVQTHLREDQPEKALEHLDQLRATDPDDPTLRYFYGGALASAGQHDAAIAEFQGLIDDGAAGERVWIELLRVLNVSGRGDAARQTLQEALAAVPDSANLLWAQASILERDGDFEGAITIYEGLYERNSDSAIVANNLASLLSTIRKDDESLQRAERIARRLRETEIPAFQDTYGWIQYLRGNYDEAVNYLEPAAGALTADAMVQAHLGLALAATGRGPEAIDQLTLALEIAADDPRAAFETARATLAELQNSDTGAGTSSTASE